MYPMMKGHKILRYDESIVVMLFWTYDNKTEYTSNKQEYNKMHT